MTHNLQVEVFRTPFRSLKVLGRARKLRVGIFRASTRTSLEKVNTYRFADSKEKMIDLLLRVTAVSVRTVEITKAMEKAARS